MVLCWYFTVVEVVRKFARGKKVTRKAHGASTSLCHIVWACIGIAVTIAILAGVCYGIYIAATQPGELAATTKAGLDAAKDGLKAGDNAAKLTADTTCVFDQIITAGQTDCTFSRHARSLRGDAHNGMHVVDVQEKKAWTFVCETLGTGEQNALPIPDNITVEFAGRESGCSLFVHILNGSQFSPGIHDFGLCPMSLVTYPNGRGSSPRIFPDDPFNNEGPWNCTIPVPMEVPNPPDSGQYLLSSGRTRRSVSNPTSVQLGSDLIASHYPLPDTNVHSPIVDITTHSSPVAGAMRQASGSITVQLPNLDVPAESLLTNLLTLVAGAPDTVGSLHCSRCAGSGCPAEERFIFSSTGTQIYKRDGIGATWFGVLIGNGAPRTVDRTMAELTVSILDQRDTTLQTVCTTEVSFLTALYVRAKAGEIAYRYQIEAHDAILINRLAHATDLLRRSRRSVQENPNGSFPIEPPPLPGSSVTIRGHKRSLDFIVSHWAQDYNVDYRTATNQQEGCDLANAGDVAGANYAGSWCDNVHICHGTINCRNDGTTIICEVIDCNFHCSENCPTDLFPYLDVQGWWHLTCKTFAGNYDGTHYDDEGNAHSGKCCCPTNGILHTQHRRSISDEDIVGEFTSIETNQGRLQAAVNQNGDILIKTRESLNLTHQELDLFEQAQAEVDTQQNNGLELLHANDLALKHQIFELYTSVDNLTFYLGSDIKFLQYHEDMQVGFRPFQWAADLAIRAYRGQREEYDCWNLAASTSKSGFDCIVGGKLGNTFENIDVYSSQRGFSRIPGTLCKAAGGYSCDDHSLQLRVTQSTDNYLQFELHFSYMQSINTAQPGRYGVVRQILPSSTVHTSDGCYVYEARGFDFFAPQPGQCYDTRGSELYTCFKNQIGGFYHSNCYGEVTSTYSCDLELPYDILFNQHATYPVALDSLHRVPVSCNSPPVQSGYSSDGDLVVRLEYPGTITVGSVVNTFASGTYVISGPSTQITITVDTYSISIFSSLQSTSAPLRESLVVLNTTVLSGFLSNYHPNDAPVPVFITRNVTIMIGGPGNLTTALASRAEEFARIETEREKLDNMTLAVRNVTLSLYEKILSLAWVQWVAVGFDGIYLLFFIFLLPSVCYNSFKIHKMNRLSPELRGKTKEEEELLGGYTGGPESPAQQILLYIQGQTQYLTEENKDTYLASFMLKGGQKLKIVAGKLRVGNLILPFSSVQIAQVLFEIHTLKDYNFEVSLNMNNQLVALPKAYEWSSGVVLPFFLNDKTQLANVRSVEQLQILGSSEWRAIMHRTNKKNILGDPVGQDTSL